MKTVTREELFALVWTTPISKLARQFGVSGVALAKTCTKYDIPRPGRGYWQQLAVGVRMRWPRLPSSKVTRPITIGRTVQSEPAGPRQVPIVRVPTKLTEPSEPARWLREAVATAKMDDHRRLVVGSRHSPAFCVRAAHVDRALRLLDAVAKALTARGLRVVVDKRHEHGEREVLVRDGDIALEVEEKLDPIPHVPTKDEQERQARWGHQVPKHDYLPAGNLRIKMAYASYRYVGQKSWSDTKTRRLDALLGFAVLGIEEASRFNKARHDEHARAEAARAADQRTRVRAARLRQYRLHLADELEEMVDQHALARRIQAFIEEYRERLPVSARTEATTAWADAVFAYAWRLDPMNRIAELAKDLEPSDDVLEQFADVGKPQARFEPPPPRGTRHT